MTKFYQGKPCKFGHTKRHKTNNQCVECKAKRDSYKERDYWSLTYVKVIVPQVTKLFWNSINGVRA